MGIALPTMQRAPPVDASDTNGDGIIDADEAEIQKGRIRKQIRKIDVNHDGAVSEQELIDAGGFRSAAAQEEAPAPLDNCHESCTSRSGSGRLKRSGHDGLCPNQKTQPLPPLCEWCSERFNQKTRHYGKCEETRRITMAEHSLYKSDFRKFDQDGTGSLERAEIQELASYQLGRPAGDCEVDALLAAIDLNGDGRITCSSTSSPYWGRAGSCKGMNNSAHQHSVVTSNNLTYNQN